MMMQASGSPLILQYILDIVTLLLGFYIAIIISRSTIGGVVGVAFRWILAGIFVLAVNHLLDTAFLSWALPTGGIWQAAIVHREINLIGFILMALGYRKLTKSKLTSD